MLNYEEISSLYEARCKLSRLFAAQGKFKEAREQAELAIELGKKHGQNNWEFFPVIMVLDAEMESGNLNEAKRVFDDAWRNAIEEKKAVFYKQLYSYWKVVLSLKMNDLEQAKAAAQINKEELAKDINKKFMRYDDILQGKIALMEKNYKDAIDFLKRAVSMLMFQCRPDWDGHDEFMWELALAYYESGDLDSAQQEFERITSLTTGRLWWGNLYAKSIYMLGKLFEEKGWPGKAIENYERFLELWKNADPGLVEVEDAKQRLARLKTS
jgi:tetratricopeptide (TPR) repeat protein